MRSVIALEKVKKGEKILIKSIEWCKRDLKYKCRKENSR